MTPERVAAQQHLYQTGHAHVVVTLIQRDGSVPCDVGGAMIVTLNGLHHGTVGGGRVEARAIQHAIQMLNNRHRAEMVRWSLNDDLGMTCGGSVTLFFAAALIDSWPIVIFGAGHVSQAVTGLLETLNCQTTVVDSRREWIDQLPPGVKVIVGSVSDEFIESLDEQTQILSLTKGHSLDLEVLSCIARAGKSFRLVGVIGSRAKADSLQKGLLDRGFDAQSIPFECPIGLDIGSNAPAEIAVSIVARLLQNRDQ
ncbi:MAG: XdhC family protein [Planctomycetota bacterium]